MARLPYQRTARYRQKLATAGAVPLPAGLGPDEIGAAAALFVTQYRQQHHTGPTWRELAAHLHPDCPATCGQHAPGAERIVPRLHTHRLVGPLVTSGWLQATRAPRSLTLGAGQ